MFKPAALFIGGRYIAAKHHTHFFSFVSLISLLGLMLGVAALVLVLSIMNGFERELEVRILGNIAHVLLESESGIDHWPQFAEQLKRADPTLKAVAPLVAIEGLFSFSGRVSGAQISGIDPHYENQVSVAHHFIRVGQLSQLQAGRYRIILGAGLADNLGVHVGDSVVMVLPQLRLTPFGALPRYKRFTVVGLVELGAQLDQSMALIHDVDAMRLLGLPVDRVKGVRLLYQNVFEAPKAAIQLRRQWGSHYQVSDWSQTQGQLFSAVKMEKIIVMLLLFLIVAVAGFNVVSGLVMLVIDKQSDIAILRTLGFSAQQIKQIFMAQGLLLGIGGSCVGIVLGLILTWALTDIMAGLQQLFHVQWFAAYYLNYIPTEIKLSDILGILTTAILLSFLGTLYPANRAAQVQPAEVLRYE